MEESTLIRIGEGSYGAIYAMPSPLHVMKEHYISDISAYEGCESWRHEYDIQREVYTRCNPLLPPGFSIVKPQSFGYAKRKNTLFMTTNRTNATSCYIIMERIHGRNDEKLNAILSEPSKFTRKSVPPFYMYLGSVEDYSAPYITLRMLKGSTLHEFERETLNYCTVTEDSVAHKLLSRMTTAFFLFVSQGFIPRDIEFVLNGNIDNTLVSILDFNEVKTIEERAAAVDEYSIEEDLANVYIDLCGLRKDKTQGVNPQAPYDYGTPQWKFLCSPMTAPDAFLSIARTLPQYSGVFQRILRKCIKPIRQRRWIAQNTVFSRADDTSIFQEFDIFFQEYIVNTLLDICYKKNIVIETISPKYDDCIQILNHKLQYRPLEWDDGFGGLF